MLVLRIEILLDRYEILVLSIEIPYISNLANKKQD